MGLHLVTGRSGFEHITPSDHGAFHNALLISGSYVLNTGNKFAANVITSNSIRLSDGELIMQGRHVRLAPGEVVSVTIENGAQDYKRNDLIVARYVKDSTTGVESVEFVVIQGTPDATATDPAYIEGNILNGILTADFPLYRVPIDGLNVGTPVQLFEVKDNFDKRISDIVNGTTKVKKAVAADSATSATSATKATLADKATADANGKNIASTYATNVKVEQILAGITDGTTPTGNAAALGGETSAEWQTKIDAKADQTAVDNIQTTSRATLSSAGWYRVAEYNADGSTVSRLQGFYGNSCKLLIKMGAAALNGETHLLQLLSAYQTQKIFSLGSIRHNPNANLAYTKCRYTYEGTKAYLEVYYALSVNNHVIFEITDGKDYGYTWQAITPTLTSETVDGVTVTTTYDIPANASPVTDLDLVRMEGDSLTTSILEKALEVDAGFYNYQSLGGSSYTGNDLPNVGYTYSPASIIKSNNGNMIVVLWGRKDVTLYPPCFNVIDATTSTWTGWNTFATTSDLTTALASYFKNTGGDITGDVTVKSSSATARALAVENSLRRVTNYIDVAGVYQLRDITNGQHIINSALDGTNTFNGTASGNIAKNGGGQINSTTREMLKLNNTSEESSGIGFYGKGTKYGEVCVSQYGLFFRDSSDTQLTIHHNGNSAKVAISATAPDDTSVLWVVPAS